MVGASALALNLNPWGLFLTGMVVIWFHGWCLADAWEGLSGFLKRGLGFCALVVLALLISPFDGAEMLARYLLCAVISTVLVMPSYFDSLVGLIRRKSGEPGFWEAFALHRNLLPSAISEFAQGLKYSLKSGQVRKSGFDRVRQAYLLAIVVAARVPDVSRTVHSAAIVRHYRLVSGTAWSRSSESLLGRLCTAAILSTLAYLLENKWRI